MPHLTCRGASSFCGGGGGGPKWITLPRICQEWFAMDGRERWRLAFEKQQHILRKTVHLCVCLGLIHWTRLRAEGQGWLSPIPSQTCLARPCSWEAVGGVG